MAIVEREVKNKHTASGAATGKAGTVYDVRLKYLAEGKYRNYVKKGFPSRRDAQQHEAEMRQKLSNPSFVPASAAQRKLTVEEYMTDWIDRHGEANLRPTTEAGYRSNIVNHIIPNIGSIPLSRLNGSMLDDLYHKLSEEGLSAASVRYVHRVLSVALEHARRYHYIESNPARDILTRFGKENETPPPYTAEQMRRLFMEVRGTVWEMLILLAGFYGLRLSECIGLRWENVDLNTMRFSVVEQLPQNLPAGTKLVGTFAPVKAGERVLPITDVTLPYFQAWQRGQRLQRQQNGEYYDNGLVLCRDDGSPLRRERISSDFKALLEKLGMPHIRFHDLRHSAGTNLHELTGDFYTVSQILGHSTKSVTARYVDVRLDRKLEVLTVYHNAVLPKAEPPRPAPTTVVVGRMPGTSK
ncbi:MAG: tyrosine-type recombinase/integrase [Oscillospiraceae bacterium]|nr:tyrosine-type recombinase/integrase [Oscillospiraceae bacterium]